MNTDNGETRSIWMESPETRAEPSLAADIDADVCIVGAGIAGMTTAYLLSGEKQRVVVLDDGPVAGGETCRTTAHLVSAPDWWFDEIVSKHGKPAAGAEKQFPAFVLAPQTASTHGVESTVATLEDVRARYRVDPTRIYVAGQSLGGYGLIDLVEARPQLFAAAVVIAANGETSAAKSLAGVPVWFFHGEHDEGVPVEGVRLLAGAVKRAGGTVRYTEYPGEGHGLAWLVVKESELVPWLLAQRRAGIK